MEHAINDPIERAFCISLNRFSGVFKPNSMDSPKPPVKSSIASMVWPPLRASYEPFNLKTKELAQTNV